MGGKKHYFDVLYSVYRVSQELGSLLWDLIPELILCQKCHIHMGPIRNGPGVMSFLNEVNKLERKEEHCAFIELCCYDDPMNGSSLYC